jgi:hypothetical protein
VRRRYLVAAGLVVAAAIAAPTVFLSTRGSGPPAPSSAVSSVSPNTLAILDAATRTQMADASGLATPGPMTVDGNILWIVARGSGLIVPYDVRFPPPGPGPPPFSAGDSPYAVAAAGGQAWVSERKPAVFWISHVGSVKDGQATPAVTSKNIRVRGLKRAGAEAVGGGYLWVIPGPIGTGNRVALIDVRHPHAAQRTIPLGLGQQTTAIAYGDGSAWVGTYDPQHGGIDYLTKVRPGSDQPPSLELETGDGAGPLAVAVGAGSVWVLTAHDNLLRIDPRNLSAEPHPIPMAAEQPEWLAVGDGFVWTANYNHNNVSQIDPRTNKIVHTTPPLGRYDARPCGIAATHGKVFVAFGETNCD